MNHAFLSLPSFAKINWSLQILGKRPDGYHEVRTILQTVSLHDDLHFEVTEDERVTLSCTDPDLATDDRNLIVRAANALKDRYKLDKGARIRLEKKIPSRAGLGGASSNAAISLLALSHLWQVKASTEALHEIGAELGSDVPFFLLGGMALATGKGTTVSPMPKEVDTGMRHLIIVSPNASVTTAEAYAALSASALTTMNTDPILSSLQSEANSRHSPPWPSGEYRKRGLKNDFEPVIFDIEPEIRRTKEALLRAGAHSALLAGSGSCVFGIFSEPEAQQRAVNEIQLEAGWRIFPCVTVSRNEYVSALSPAMA